MFSTSSIMWVVNSGLLSWWILYAFTNKMCINDLSSSETCMAQLCCLSLSGPLMRIASVCRVNRLVNLKVNCGLTSPGLCVFAVSPPTPLHETNRSCNHQEFSGQILEVVVLRAFLCCSLTSSRLKAQLAPVWPECPDKPQENDKEVKIIHKKKHKNRTINITNNKQGPDMFLMKVSRLCSQIKVC